MNLHQDKWPEPLTKGQQYLRSVGETPDSMRLHRERDQKAQAKRERRIERNIRNELAQGRGPDGLWLVNGEWTAQCRSCGNDYALGHDLCDFTDDMSYCGRSEGCCP